jgi:ribosomal protein S18 acetylase RimI-like enzyme
MLEKKDFKEYLNLMKQFRPIEKEITYDKFCEIYDKIFTSSEIYVARIDNKIIGSVTIIYEQKFINNSSIYAHIEDVIVDEEYRNLKIGTQLLDHAKKCSIEKNCFKCTLVCSKEVSTFYIKNNFEERGVNMSFLI